MKSIFYTFNPKSLKVEGGFEDYNPFGFEVEE